MLNDLLRALGFKKQRGGVELVTEVTATFDEMVGKLKEGIELINDDIDINQSRITQLKADNTVLGGAKVTALNLVRGIEGLISGS